METPPTNKGVWKLIDQFEDYMVSSQGCVWSKFSHKIMKPEVTHGYYRVSLRRDKKGYHSTIHRLVATAFIPNPDSLPHVNHKDENRLNNKVENLEWTTAKQNTKYSCSNSESFSSKVSVGKSVPVVQYTLQGEYVQRYDSITTAGKETGIGVVGISKCCRGGLKTSGKYVWRFEVEDMCPDDVETIPGVDPYYKVTTEGRVFNSQLRRYLKPLLLKSGYHYVKLPSGGRKNSKQIHRLVAEAYLPNPDNKPYVNHKNSDRQDNRLENLEWSAPSENSYHAAKYGNAETRGVKQIDLDGNVVGTFSSIMDAERSTGISNKHISCVCKGKYGRNTSGGYKWQYVSVRPDDIPQTRENQKWRRVRQLSLSGSELNTYKNIAEASRVSGVHRSSIQGVCAGKRPWAVDYKWEYI